MLGSIKRCSTMFAKKNNKTRPPVKMKPMKIPKGAPLPIFQYPISQPDDRRVYVWGLADHGALGTLGRTSRNIDFNYIAKPSRLHFAEHHKVTNITCGYGFTVFGVKSKDKNIIYGCGINTDSQLGFVEIDRHRQGKKAEIIPIPRPIPLPLKNESSEVIDIAAGRAHLLVLTTEGLFTLGNNGYGQCGRTIIPDEEYFDSRVVNYIPNIKGSKITAVTAGQDHSMILSENGEVYTFGWGADGQTGLAHYRNEWQPSLVKGDLSGEKIIKLACVADCVLALSDKGHVFGWGNAEYGQLPVEGDNRQINIATELEDCAKLGQIVDIASGGSFCMILTSTGDVYVWGYGILGFGPEVTRVQIPTLIPNTLFGNNPYQPDIKVIKIYCGMTYLAAVTNTGDLFMWGRNKYGNLGFGNCKDQFFPLKVSIGAQVKHVACGIDHTVTICKPFI
ncbi:hypothetical protein PV326_007295 [Microctonus aethiopoides]|nr:hypothetical protein PV326_007295 [Microctonus aethiopoides]